jgi:hypothetical protein
VNNVVTKIATPYSTGHIPCPYGCGGGLYKLNPVDPYSLKAAWFQPLNVSSENLVSSLFACKLQLVPLHRGRSFKHATQKAIHIRKVHTGERPFVCKVEDCKKAFYSSGDLKSHEKTHSVGGCTSCESSCDS